MLAFKIFIMSAPAASETYPLFYSFQILITTVFNRKFLSKPIIFIPLYMANNFSLKILILLAINKPYICLATILHNSNSFYERNVSDSV